MSHPTDSQSPPSVVEILKLAIIMLIKNPVIYIAFFVAGLMEMYSSVRLDIILFALMVIAATHFEKERKKVPNEIMYFTPNKVGAVFTGQIVFIVFGFATTLFIHTEEPSSASINLFGSAIGPIFNLVFAITMAVQLKVGLFAGTFDVKKNLLGWSRAVELTLEISEGKRLHFLKIISSFLMIHFSLIWMTVYISFDDDTMVFVFLALRPIPLAFLSTYIYLTVFGYNPKEEKQDQRFNEPRTQ